MNVTWREWGDWPSKCLNKKYTKQKKKIIYIIYTHTYTHTRQTERHDLEEEINRLPDYVARAELSRGKMPGNEIEIVT